jgi:Spy/CpxP family protein refolding chaperone
MMRGGPQSQGGNFRRAGGAPSHRHKRHRFSHGGGMMAQGHVGPPGGNPAMMADGRGGFGGGFGGPGGGGRGMMTGAGMGGSLHIGPPGMWWKNPAIVSKLTLSAEQTKKMDDIFQASRLRLVDLHANVEKQDLILQPMLSANPVDQVKTLAQIDKVAQARADLEKENAKMLLGIRGVLTPDQWTKLNTRTGPDAMGQPPAGPAGPGNGPGNGGPGGGGPAGRRGQRAPAGVEMDDTRP